MKFLLKCAKCEINAVNNEANDLDPTHSWMLNRKVCGQYYSMYQHLLFKVTVWQRYWRMVCRLDNGLWREDGAFR
jgi:hypothetical protein